MYLANTMVDNINFVNAYHDKLITWGNGYKQHKTYQKDIEKELMYATWYSLRWWDWYMPEDENNEAEKI